ncbi:histidinol-phosphate transaminase [Streptomyces sp. NPDC017979]|uniref:histidinol-phosphate transaminase n=1 Tax=Streptomyces sp. NPDC017979 TaxID=3365024 RepID=UPI0037A889C7
MDVLRLHCNESPYGPPMSAVAAATDELNASGARYPDSECALLRERIARHVGTSGEMVAVGNGTDELLFLITLTCAGPGGQVLVTDSTFPGYLNSAAAVGSSVKTVPLNDRRISAQAVIDALGPDVKVVYVCNPHNPTGTVLPPADVERIVDAADAAGAILVLDEAYMEFLSSEGGTGLDAVKAGRRVIVLRTFSKAWGLASLRIGYAVAHPELIGRIERGRRALPFNVNRLAQGAAAAALDSDGFIEGVRSRTSEARERFYRRLAAAGVEYVPSVTNFVLVNVECDSSVVAQQLADEHGVIVRDLELFGLPGHLRVTIGTEQQVDRFCSALESVLSSLAAEARRDTVDGRSDVAALPL